jgi:hypothetical protein
MKIPTIANSIYRKGFCKGMVFKLAAPLKQDELLETPEEDNQQPSLNSNILEGSTTNSQILPSNVEDGNADTSVLHGYKTSESVFKGINFILKDNSELFVPMMI